MPYFNNIPNIEYSQKPITYPFSEFDYVVAKNFFKKYQLNPDVFSYAVFFNKYSILENERIYDVANKAYGDPGLDWIVILTNNLVSPLFDWPMTGTELRKYVENNYFDPYAEIAYYETVERSKSDGGYIIQPNLKVDETFYNTPYKYFDNDSILTIDGSEISRAVTVYEDEGRKNEARREIYILKPQYLQAFITNFKENSKYAKSNSFINNRLKRTDR